MLATIEALKMFITKVFPTMFPFFIITRILTILGLGNMFVKLLKRPIKLLYNCSGIGGYVFVLSILSGYPIGAKLVADFVKNGIISQDEAKKIISFTSTSGPLFIIGTIGVNLLGDYNAGVVILVSHFLSAILNGILYRGQTNARLGVSLPINENADFFNDAITSSIQAILQVASSIVFLNVLIVALNDLNIIDIFANTLSIFGLDKGVSKGISIGLIEITKGIYDMASSNKIKDIIVPISTIISFGGISVMVQSMSFLRTIGISTKYYLLTKTSQAIISYVLSTLLVLMLY